MRKTPKIWIKKIVFIFVGMFTLALANSICTYAKGNRTEDQMAASSYIERRVRSVYHNMQLVFEAYYDVDGNLQKQAAGNVAIEQSWDGDELASKSYLDQNGQPINRVDGYSKAVWKRNKEGTKYIAFFDVTGSEIDIEGLNLIGQEKSFNDGWSEWFSPDSTKAFTLFTVDEICLGKKAEGDLYTCQFDIEFSNVTVPEGKSFEFKTQGKTDGEWNGSNLWWVVAYMNKAPKDGIYTFSKTVRLDSKMADASVFEIGFRCDNWLSGAFRIRNIKIEKGASASEWTPGI